ncbi:MAG: hypothetical protein ACJA0H_001691 [Francisellaceae bacterium]|jgi:hypothetical protein
MKKELRASFNDRNGKFSSKRLWGAVTLCNGLLIAWSSMVVKVLLTVGYIVSENEFIIDTTLILGIITAGAGLFVSTYAEPQNKMPIDKNPYSQEETIN